MKPLDKTIHLMQYDPDLDPFDDEPDLDPLHDSSRETGFFDRFWDVEPNEPLGSVNLDDLPEPSLDR